MSLVIQYIILIIVFIWTLGMIVFYILLFFKPSLVTKNNPELSEKTALSEVEVIYYNAYLKYLENKFCDSVTELDKITTTDQPETFDTLKLRATCLEKLGYLSESVENISKALNLVPKEAELIIMRALIHQKLGNFKLAHEDFRNAITLNKKFEIYIPTLFLLDSMSENEEFENIAKKRAENLGYFELRKLN